MPLISQRNFNAAIGILGIFALGVFLDWFPKAFLGIPMPEGLVANSFANTLWQVVVTICIPVYWAIKRLGFSLADLGLSTRNLGKTLLLGCLLYSLALAAFIHCSDDPLISNHALGKIGFWEAVGLTSSMGLVAAGTDVATRGFVLFTLARYTHVGFAIFVQNLTWYLGHIHELNILRNCLGYGTALALVLTLGLLGDAIALKTRNVVGLAIAHILLNIVLAVYIRQL
ncbi:MAG TPA: hypothetical protein ENK29_03150 [Chromatiales bacterium]|nr:hypothetical protein [Chromatiales bacterium]